MSDETSLDSWLDTSVDFTSGENTLDSMLDKSDKVLLDCGLDKSDKSALDL